MAKAGRYDITLQQGATFISNITWSAGEPAVPVDITGYTARMHVRANISDVSSIIELTTENGRIVLTDPVNGAFQLLIAADDTEALSFTGKAVYDLELVSPALVVTRLLEGTVELSEEVTR